MAQKITPADLQIKPPAPTVGAATTAGDMNNFLGRVNDSLKLVDSIMNNARGVVATAKEKSPGSPQPLPQQAAPTGAAPPVAQGKSPETILNGFLIALREAQKNIGDQPISKFIEYAESPLYKPLILAKLGEALA